MLNILGISLTKPHRSNLLAALVAGGLMIIVFFFLTVYEILSTTSCVVLSASSIGGTLANAYGASIKTNGWRGAIISSMFSVLLMAVAYILMHLFFRSV